MKKIVLASAAMGGAALLAFGASGTFAAFSDQTTINNSAGAGTLFLTSSTPSRTAEEDALTLAPGDTASFAYFVQNGGDTAGSLQIALELAQNNENGCLPPELRSESDCYADGNGELPGVARAFYTYLPEGTTGQNCKITASRRQDDAQFAGTLTEVVAAGSQGVDNSLAGGEGRCIVLDVVLFDDRGTGENNSVQGDTVRLDTVFTLTQATS